MQSKNCEGELWKLSKTSRYVQICGIRAAHMPLKTLAEVVCGVVGESKEHLTHAGQGKKRSLILKKKRFANNSTKKIVHAH